MPISYAILKPHQDLYEHFNGKIRLADFNKLSLIILSDVDFKPSLWELVDMRASNLSGMSNDDIVHLATLTIFNAGVKRAFVAVNLLEFGLARMYEAHAQSIGQWIQVFHSMGEACQWLDLPVKALRASDTGEGQTALRSLRDSVFFTAS